MSKIYSITASYYDYENKYLLIDYMLGSCKKNNIIKSYISISFKNEFEYNKYKKYINLIQNKYKDRISLYIHLERKFQFEQLLFLSKILKKEISLDDKILFIDDDDLLLNLPPKIEEYNIIQGYQYLTLLHETDYTKFYMRHEILDFIKLEQNKLWKKLIDFSGYITPLKLLIDFFKVNKINYESFNKKSLTKLSSLSLNLMDCKFMDFIDNNIKPGELKYEPFIYHRLWSVPERPKPSWQTTI